MAYRTNTTLKAELRKLGVQVRGRLTNAELEQRLKDAQEAPESNESDETPKDDGNYLEISDDADIEVKARKASVYDMYGDYIRTYSDEVHGQKFMELAQMYAGKIKGTVR